MRIGEFEATIAKDIAQRRSAMAAELTQLGAKLSEPADGTGPASRLADAVRISPEARAAHLAVNAPPTPENALPTPADLAAALRAVLQAPDGPAGELAAGELARALRQLAAAFQCRLRFPVSDATAPAAALARMLLVADPHAPLDAGRVRELVRNLLLHTGRGAFADGSVTVIDRASAALLAAAVAASASPPADPHSTLAFPSALLSLAAQVPPVRRRRPDDEDETDEDAGDEGDSEGDARDEATGPAPGAGRFPGTAAAP